MGVQRIWQQARTVGSSPFDSERTVPSVTANKNDVIRRNSDRYCWADSWNTVTNLSIAFGFCIPTMCYFIQFHFSAVIPRSFAPDPRCESSLKLPARTAAAASSHSPRPQKKLSSYQYWPLPPSAKIPSRLEVTRMATNPVYRNRLMPKVTYLLSHPGTVSKSSPP